MYNQHSYRTRTGRQRSASILRQFLLDAPPIHHGDLHRFSTPTLAADMALVKIISVLFALTYSSTCTGNPLVTDADVARLSGLLEDLSSQLRDLHDRVTTDQVTIRSVEATVNRLVSENAQLKASVRLLEDAVSQRAQLETISKRLAAVEASNSEARESNTLCSLPFTEVFGRCVYADSSKSGAWEEMRQHCRTMDSDLVIIDSADFMWHLIRHLHETGQDRSSYWVGGHRKSATAAFHWVDGRAMKMGTPFWGHWNALKQQPYDGLSELHVCMADKGFYFLHSCGLNHMQPPICQRT
ncbi:uncharacterized protein LOC143038230 [Oratosquilla oratoria]|uniref:uncharacterized protein LOC143038230 n=1 Tax=Oratosquilla oratoria TaxID=337810 RepID=UPI003F768957